MKYEYTSFVEPLFKEDASSKPKERDQEDLNKIKDTYGAKGWCIYQDEISETFVIWHAVREV